MYLAPKKNSADLKSEGTKLVCYEHWYKVSGQEGENEVEDGATTEGSWLQMWEMQVHHDAILIISSGVSETKGLKVKGLNF